MTGDEFSRPVRVEPLPKEGIEQRIEANEAERAALARRNNLPAIAKLSAQFRISRQRRGVRVEGELSALVTQTCVVSLEPFEVEVVEPIDVKFLPEGSTTAALAEGEEDTDEIVDGRIDLGALAAEFLTLGLDPYPRKPGVVFAPPVVAEDGETPFAPPGKGEPPS